LILVLFDDLMLETENELVILSLVCSIFLDRSNFLHFFHSSSLPLNSVIGAGVPRLRWGIRALNCRDYSSMMKIRLNLWEFTLKLHWFWFKLASETVRVRNSSWWIFVLICNCQERENWVCLWCGAWIHLILTLCTIYSLPCVILTNEVVTRGLDSLRGTCGLNLKKKRTKMQIWKE